MSKSAGWLDRLSYAKSLKFLKKIARVHAVQAGRFSEDLCRFIDTDDWRALLDYRITYERSDSVSTLIHARQALAFFQKLEPLKVEGVESKTLNAFRKFARTEVTCRKVNDRFCRYKLGIPMGYPYDLILTDARRKIANILGTAPSLDELEFGFGPGATVLSKKKEALHRFKLGSPPACSKELAPFVDRLLSQVPPYTLLHATEVGLDFADVDVQIVPGRLEFVFKNAEEYRTIDVQPPLNVLFQQGVGKAVRKRLRRAGIDLSDQSRNKGLAKLGSMTDHLATVDFSSASDTIATQMVAFLLPEDWFVLLSLGRTSTTSFEGLLIPMEKFSTMGTSFTFELESLIFYALAWSVLRYLALPNGELSIYGDDLVIPSEAYPLAELVFAFCGFTINSKKSYVRGPFRESCGGDYFEGIDIRPYYQSDLVSPESLFTLHNFYMRNGELTLAALVRNELHPDLIIFGPDGYGDGHLIGDWNPSRKHVIYYGVDAKGKRRKYTALPADLGWEGCFFTSYRHVSPVDFRHHVGDPLLPCFSIYARGECQDPPAKSSKGKLWADSKYFIAPGSVGYEKISIYTRHRGVFLR